MLASSVKSITSVASVSFSFHKARGRHIHGYRAKAEIGAELVARNMNKPSLNAARARARDQREQCGAPAQTEGLQSLRGGMALKTQHCLSPRSGERAIQEIFERCSTQTFFPFRGPQSSPMQRRSCSRLRRPEAKFSTSFGEQFEKSSKDSVAPWLGILSHSLEPPIRALDEVVCRRSVKG